MSNVYEKGEVPAGERRRLEQFEYPTMVSRTLVEESDIAGQTVLDVGSGSSTALGRFVQDRGGVYIALDVREDYLDAQRRENLLAVRGTALALPFASGSMGLLHMRFVLMHLPPDERSVAIREAARVARHRRALFLEFDWGGMSGGDLVREFIEFATSFLQGIGAEPFMGAMLGQEVEASLPFPATIVERVFRSPPGDYYGEILPLAETMKGVLAARKDEQRLAALADIAARLDAESKKQKPERFTRPDIVAVEVTVC